MPYSEHNILRKSFRSNRDKGVLNPELRLLQAMHFPEGADKNAREYKYIFSKRFRIRVIKTCPLRFLCHPVQTHLLLFPTSE